jgi:hypothetical protein
MTEQLNNDSRASLGHWIEMPIVSDPRGSLSFIEGCRHIPFTIKRVYILFGVTPGSSRGGHAHKELKQVIMPVSGSFDVVLDDGLCRQSFHLSQPNVGLMVPTMVWRELTNFSRGAVCMSLASELYDEGDYFRDYDAFLAARQILVGK